MTAYEQLRRYLEDVTVAIQEAIPLVDEDPKKTPVVLGAIIRDLWKLDQMLESWHPL